MQKAPCSLVLPTEASFQQYNFPSRTFFFLMNNGINRRRFVVFDCNHENDGASRNGRLVAMMVSSGYSSVVVGGWWVTFVRFSGKCFPTRTFFL